METIWTLEVVTGFRWRTTGQMDSHHGQCVLPIYSVSRPCLVRYVRVDKHLASASVVVAAVVIRLVIG